MYRAHLYDQPPGDQPATNGHPPEVSPNSGNAEPPQEAAAPPPLSPEVEDFFQRYPCDERAVSYLVTSPQAVLERALKEFHPPREGEGDYSALLVTYVRNLRADQVNLPQPDAPPLGAEIDAFRQRFPVDEDAYNYLVNSPYEVQRKVMADFKPPREGEADYSALLIRFTKRLRQDARMVAYAVIGPGPTPQPRPAGGGGGGGSGGGGGCGGHAGNVSCAGGAGGAGLGGCPPVMPPHGLELASLRADVEAFRHRFPLDEAALNYLLACQPEVQAQVMREFRPPREGDGDYSALLISFAKRCRQVGVPMVPQARAPPLMEPARPPPRHNYHDQIEVFRQRYPLDLDAYNYLVTSQPEVQRAVLQDFRPPREGERDYSALVISFTKRVRQTQAGGTPFILHGGAVPAARPAPYVLRNGAPGRPPAAPMGGARAPPLQHPGSLVAQRPQYMPPPFPARPRLVRPEVGHHGGGGCHRAPGVDINAFRMRFPMDERAFSYLEACSREVQREVVMTFAPKRLDDTDFSAPIVAYAKLCRARFGGPGAAPPQHFAGKNGGMAFGGGGFGYGGKGPGEPHFKRPRLF